MANPWRWWPAEEIARATGCPTINVASEWPSIADALDERGIYERDVCRGVLGTIAVETASTFTPLHEYGTPADWARYGGGPRYAGRGYIQLTHDYNYRAAGEALGIDLLGNPDLAMRPAIAARILAWYWATKTIPSKDGTRRYSLVELCREHDWYWTRKAVQGGTNGLDRLQQIVADLGETLMPVTYNPQEPAHAQDKSFDCSQESLEWALWSLGRRPDDSWMEQTMMAEGVMSSDLGLLDASGAGLAAFVGRHYGEFGFYANNEPSITFDGAALEGGHTYPLLIGGRAWGHWSGLKGYDAANDLLILANPANGWKGVGQTMNRAQFAALGPFSMVRVLHPDLLGETTPDPEPAAPSRAAVLVSEIEMSLAGVETRLAELKTLVA